MFRIKEQIKIIKIVSVPNKATSIKEANDNWIN